jgi:putative PIN family toxin of toxin-antitoxin system
MRVLLDTNVLVRATGTSSGPARSVLLALLEAPHVIIVSSFLLDELRRVLKYPRVGQIHGLTEIAINEYIRDLIAAAEFIDVPPSLTGHVAHDPDDDPIVACAVYGRADVLCTRDRHLRSPQVLAYCANFKIRVMTDVELAAELRSGESASSQ